MLTSSSSLFSTVEKEFARLSVENEPLIPEPAVQFITYLFAVARRGHLHVKVEGNEVDPEPNVLISEGEIDRNVLIEGASLLPPSLCKDKTTPFVKSGPFYYLQRFYQAAKNVEAHWRRLSTPSLSLPIDLEKYKIRTEAISENPLNKEQQEALIKGLLRSPFILTGGPGSGKTFTAGKLLNLMREVCGIKYFSEQVALAAPTGKAALALQHSLAKSLGDENVIKAQTLHALLGLAPVMKKTLLPPSFLPYSVYVIDEASMIDIELMETLLSRIRSGSFLLLIGDPCQLPPVDGPPIFPELVKNHFHKTELVECKRLETLHLLEAAKKLSEKEPLEKVFDVKPLDTEKDLQKLLEGWIDRWTPVPEGIEEAFRLFRRFKILTPYRHTKWGSEAINQKIAKWIHKKGESILPVVMTRNDYDLGFFNGDNALLKKVEDKVVFEGDLSLPSALLSSFELGYASTIHKSQGSEYEEVALLLPPEGIFSEALLYTAVTRARKKISVFKLPK